MRLRCAARSAALPAIARQRYADARYTVEFKVIEMLRQWAASLLLLFALAHQADAQSTKIYAAAHGGPAALVSTLYTLDAGTGNATPVMDTGRNLGALAIAPSGALYGVEMVGILPFLVTYDPADRSSI